MALNKYKLGDLIENSNTKNVELIFDLNAVRGISTQKQFIETNADMAGVPLNNYKIVRPHYFSYVPDTSRRGEKISLGFNVSTNTYLVSSISTVFKVKSENVLLPYYLYIYFNRPEFDRYARFNSWGSAREVFSWEDLCDIDIDLPDLATQQKYVDIYLAMVENQKAYERGLSDLKLTCDGYFDVAKHKNTKCLGDLIEKVDNRNVNCDYKKDSVKGITNNKEFAETKADIDSVDLSKFKIVRSEEFAYNSRTDGRDMLVLALNRPQAPVIVTFNYNVFKVKDKNKVLPEYLYAFFKRGEFDRRVRFNSWGSSQELLTWENLCDIKVPVPDINEQRAFALINAVYIKRKEINEKLKTQIKNLCPILIKGSLNEGK